MKCELQKIQQQPTRRVIYKRFIMNLVLLILVVTVNSSFSQLLTLKGQLDYEVKTVIDVDGDDVPELLADTNGYFDGTTYALKYKIPGVYPETDDNWDALNPYMRFPHADYNLDGRRDIIHHNYEDSTLNIIDVSNGSILFSFNFAAGFDYEGVICLADIDNDQKLELLVAASKIVDPQTYDYDKRTYILSTLVSTNSVASPSLEAPLNFGLSQNYPNPFNPTTSIEYEIQTRSHASIRIYNSLGQLVTTLFDEEKTPGGYAERWDGKDDRGVSVATGAYYYQLQVGDFVSSKKMLLIK